MTHGCRYQILRFMSDLCIDFFMNWIAGLPITVAQKCQPWLRVIFLPIALIWIPVILVLFLPLLVLWAFITMIQGFWELMAE